MNVMGNIAVVQKRLNALVMRIVRALILIAAADGD